MKEIKVAIISIGRMENRYVREFVSHYRNLGASKVLIYDNNYDGEEHFEDVLSDYIEEGVVEVVDFRNKAHCQLNAYQDGYDRLSKDYDWLCFFDFDEFLVFQDPEMTLQKWLSNSIYNKFKAIHVNWKCYGDNGNIEYEDKPLMERFPNPKEPITFTKSYEWPENMHIKSVIRGKGRCLWVDTPHTPMNYMTCCQPNGKECDSTAPTAPLEYSVCWLNHYYTKSLEEFLDNKMMRGYPDNNVENDPFKAYFTYNEPTKEKFEWIEKKNDEVCDIFVFSHKEFEPVCRNKVYKNINTREVEKVEGVHGLDDRFFSEIYGFFHVADKLPLKKYVGTNHYRRYFEFMDNVPYIDWVMRDCDVLLAQPIQFEGTVREQYCKYHNFEDLAIAEYIIRNKFPEYAGAMDRLLNGNIMFPYNMFIVDSERFKEYTTFMKSFFDEFLNAIGDDIEKRINERSKALDKYNPSKTGGAR